MKLAHTAIVLLLMGTGASRAASAPHGVLGDWMEPTGSVIRIEPCGSSVCARLITLSHAAPTTVDANNPEPAARSRPLCGLVLGRGFELPDPDHAEGGTLYDPKSGKTYRGSMKADGDRLELRGYIGIKLFGRTETWRRVQQAVVCSAAQR